LAERFLDERAQNQLNVDKCKAMAFVINTPKLPSAQLCMVSHSSGKGPGNPSSFRQLLQAVGQGAKRTVNKISSRKHTYFSRCPAGQAYLQGSVATLCPILGKIQETRNLSRKDGMIHCQAWKWGGCWGYEGNPR
jgi:hypothetical protein